MNSYEQRSTPETQVAGNRTVNVNSAFAWIPALMGVAVICCESTRAMGADHTMLWLSRICTPLVRLPNADIFELNHVLRKCGHFFGYGTLGLVLMQGWLSLLLTRLHGTWSRLRLCAGGLAVLSVSLIASMDEVHQSFLPNRTACFSDVLLDTAGALLLVSLASLLLVVRRRRMLVQRLQARLLQRRHTSSWLFASVLLDESR